MILLEEANHAIGLVDQHMTEPLVLNVMKGGAGSFMQVKELTEEETMGQGNIGERGNYCRLATSVDCSSRRKFDRAQLSQARTHELNLGIKMVSDGAQLWSSA